MAIFPRNIFFRHSVLLPNYLGNSFPQTEQLPKPELPSHSSLILLLSVNLPLILCHRPVVSRYPSMLNIQHSCKNALGVTLLSTVYALYTVQYDIFPLKCGTACCCKIRISLMDVPAPLASVLLGPSSAALNFEFKFLCLSPASPLSLSSLAHI